MNSGSVEKAYNQLKEMATSYVFKPDSRLNEVELAKKLETSRTPLREALNRLVAEGFLTFKSGKGFFCRSLTPKKIMDLYEARAAIECEAVRLATYRATNSEIITLENHLVDSEKNYVSKTSSTDLVLLDEYFHIQLTKLSGNAEMISMLKNMNGRIHYYRLIDLKTLSERNGSESVTTKPHMQILNAVKQRDAFGAQQEMKKHIERRLECITETVKAVFANLYTD